MGGSRFTLRVSRSALCALLLLAFLTFPGVIAIAQSGGGYDLSWWTVDSGGATFSLGGGYTLGGTIGQPDAGVLSGSGYTLVGGFWAGAVAQYRIYLPLVLRDFP